MPSRTANKYLALPNSGTDLDVERPLDSTIITGVKSGDDSANPGSNPDATLISGSIPNSATPASPALPLLVNSLLLPKLEKVYLLFGFFQQVGFLHAIAFSLWPNSLMHHTRFVTVSTLDVPHLSQPAMMYNEYDSSLPAGYYDTFALFLSFLPALLHIVLRFSPQRNLSSAKTLWLILTDALLLPMFIATSRLFMCTDTSKIKEVTYEILYTVTYSLDVDPEISCNSGGHVFATVVATALTLATFIHFFRMSMSIVNDAVTYTSPFDHEKLLQRYEIEYMLGLSSDYSDHFFYVFSSYQMKKFGCFRLQYTLIVRFTEGLLYLFLYKSEKPLLISIIWTLFTFTTIFNFASPPFRQGSSNVVLHAVNLALVFNTTFLLFTVQQIRTAFILPTRQTALLASFGMGFLVVILVYTLYVRFVSKEQWPSVATLYKLSRNDKLNFVDALECIKKNTDVANTSYVGPVEMIPIHEIEEQMRKTRGLLSKALKVKSVFAITLNSSLDDLAHLHQTSRNDSVLPGGRLALTLAESATSLSSRRFNLSLQNPKKRSILLKLLSVRFLIGKRKFRTSNTWEFVLIDEAKMLEEDTLRMLTVPMKISIFSKDSIEAVEELSKSWKALLKKWEQSFTANKFRTPDKGDKMERMNWYRRYKKCHAAVELLKQRNPPVGLSATFNAELEALVAKVDAFWDSSWGDDAVTKVGDLVSEIKGLIKGWEGAFMSCFGMESVSNKVKKDFEGDMYELYNRLKGVREKVTSFDERSKEITGQFAHAMGKKDEGALESIGKDFKELIKDWLEEFNERTGREMTSDDKRARTEWYNMYKEVKVESKSILQKKKATKKLSRDTKELLRTDARSIKKSELLKLKSSWKKIIRDWVNAFLLKEGRPPNSEDKLQIKSYYVYYKALGEKGLEMDKIALENMSDDLDL